MCKQQNMYMKTKKPVWKKAAETHKVTRWIEIANSIRNVWVRMSACDEMKWISQKWIKKRRQQHKQHNHSNDMFVYWTGRLALVLALAHYSCVCISCAEIVCESKSCAARVRIFSSLSLNFGSFIHFEIHRILKWLMYAARDNNATNQISTTTTTINQQKKIINFVQFCKWIFRVSWSEEQRTNVAFRGYCVRVNFDGT